MTEYERRQKRISEMPKPETWSADEVRAALKTGRKSMVLKSNGDFKNLYADRAARMVGNFKVEVSPYEIVIHDNYERT